MVHDTIRVPTDDTLVIMPGVDVVFLGHYRLAVDSGAVLKALGSVTDTIRFLPSDTGEWSPGWHGIRFYHASDACSLSYCELAYGYAYGLCEDDSCGGAVWSYYSNPTIEYCSIHDCWANKYGGAMYFYNSILDVHCCDIEENSADYDGGGIYATHSSSGFIDSCLINDNNSPRGGGVKLRTNYVNIFNCDIMYNSSYGILVESAGPTEAYCSGNRICYNNSYGIHANGTYPIFNNEISNNGDGGIYSYYNGDIRGNIISNNNGAGIYFQSHSDTVEGNYISGNLGEDGGGIHIEFASSTILNNIIQSNIANDGGGIYSYRNHEMFIIDNYIMNNEANQGGGVYLTHIFSTEWDIDPVIICNTIKNNSASQGGGIWSSNEPRISNNMISHNTATSGAGIYMTGKPCISNNTIVYNNGDGCYFSGYYKGMLNTIVYGNTGYEIYADSPCSVGFAYCDIDTEDVFGSVILWGPGIINADPLFEDTLFHLSESSPCISAGVQMYYFPTISEEIWADIFDFEGDFRPVRIWDIGADEYDTSSYIAEVIHRPSKLDIIAYPNPFNSAVTISAPKGAEIEVFDIKGRIVYEMPVGAYRDTPAIWTPDKSLGSGVYLVHAKIGNESVTKRIVYLK